MTLKWGWYRCEEGLTPTAIPLVMEVDANLLTSKIKKLKTQSVNFYYDYLPKENHATIMHQAAHNAFKLLFPVVSKVENN
jgi:uncharacterized protein